MLRWRPLKAVRIAAPAAAAVAMIEGIVATAKTGRVAATTIAVRPGLGTGRPQASSPSACRAHPERSS